MDIYINETVSSPPPSTKTSQEATTYFTIPPKTTTPTAEPTKSKNCGKKCMYGFCFIVVLATAGIAIASLIIALSSNELNKEMKTKLEKIESQARLNEEFRKFWQATSKNCYKLANLGVRTSGVYNITAGKKIIEVYCDMETDGGGWTVIQRRVSNVTDFYREFSFYKVGFGSLTGNFWLGLDNIHAITSSGSYQLRVDLRDFTNNQAYALYSSFSVGNESSNYTLHVSGYSGNAGDSLTYHNNQPFSTKDRDNDANSGNCAVQYHGAWWYGGCYNSNLNGKYFSSGVNDENGIKWNQWISQSLKRVEMKIKPN